MPDTSPIDIANIPPPTPIKHSPTSSTYTTSTSTASGFSTSPRTPGGLPTMTFSPLTRTTSRDPSGVMIVGGGIGSAGGGATGGPGSGGYFGGAALGRTISGGTGAGAAGSNGLGLMGDKSKKGEGVLRRLSLSGMGGFRPSFLSPNPQATSTSPNTQSNASTSITTATGFPPSTSAPSIQPARMPQDPFSGGAIHEEEIESTDSVPGLTRAHSVGKQDRPRRVSFGWPGFGGGGAGVGHDATSGLPPQELDPTTSSTIPSRATRADSISSTNPSPPFGSPDEIGRKVKVSFAGSLEDSELGLGKIKSLESDGQRRGRRNSESAGNKGRRGVSPMGEHILRGGGHF